VLLRLQGAQRQREVLNHIRRRASQPKQSEHRSRELDIESRAGRGEARALGIR